MKTQLIEGVAVLVPQNADQLREAVNSGQPFLAPEPFAKDFALPTDAHVVDGEDVGVLDTPDEE